MPLENAPEGSPGFSRNVATEMKAGKPQKQAVAIAYSKARSDAEPVVGQEAKTVYGKGKIVKVNRESVVVECNGKEFKLSRKQYGIMNDAEPEDDCSLDSILDSADKLFARADSVAAKVESRSDGGPENMAKTHIAALKRQKAGPDKFKAAADNLRQSAKNLERGYAEDKGGPGFADPKDPAVITKRKEFVGDYYKAADLIEKAGNSVRGDSEKEEDCAQMDAAVLIPLGWEGQDKYFFRSRLEGLKAERKQVEGFKRREISIGGRAARSAEAEYKPQLDQIDALIAYCERKIKDPKTRSDSDEIADAERQISVEETRKMRPGSWWSTGSSAAGNLKHWTNARNDANSSNGAEFVVRYVNSADKTESIKVRAGSAKEAEDKAKNLLGKEIYRVVQVTKNADAAQASINQAARRSDADGDAYAAGRAARRAGKGQRDCPARPGSPNYEQWRNGWGDEHRSMRVDADEPAIGSEAREEMPADVFLQPGERKYPVKKKRDGVWVLNRELLVSAAREARAHGHDDIAEKADHLRSMKFDGGETRDDANDPKIEGKAKKLFEEAEKALKAGDRKGFDRLWDEAKALVDKHGLIG